MMKARMPTLKKFVWAIIQNNISRREELYIMIIFIIFSDIDSMEQIVVDNFKMVRKGFKIFVKNSHFWEFLAFLKQDPSLYTVMVKPLCCIRLCIK